MSACRYAITAHRRTAHRARRSAHGLRLTEWRRASALRASQTRASMAGLIEAIDIKRKMYFEYEEAPYHCLDVDVSKPTARGGQTLVRVKMRNLLTRAVFDRTFKAGEKFREPDLAKVSAVYQYAD